MIISYKLLQAYFDEKLPKPEALAEALTFHAFEIEGMEQKGKDTAIDVKILPNRAHDCLSHRGVAKEVSSILEIPLRKVSSAKFPKAQKGVPVVSVAIRDARALRYTGIVIEGITVKESPKWLADVMSTLGQRSINNVVDATNYVMFQLGQPLHAFDYAKLSGGKIIVRPGKEGETLTTLDGKEVALSPSMMVIADAQTPLVIAGIKGGVTAEIDNTTTAIFLEAANFDASTIRLTSQRINIKTDASKRYESSLTPEITAEALVTVTQLICDIAGTPETRVGSPVDVYPKKAKTESVSITETQVNRILGTTFSAREIELVWKRLRFAVTKKKHGSETEWKITIPHERLDLRIKEDLAEEVGRMMGYHKLTPTFPRETISAPEINAEWRVRDIMREVLLGYGFSEVYTYAFLGAGEIEVANPLAGDKKYLRNNLMNGLKLAVIENLKYETDVRIFEFGHIFGKEKGAVREESSFALLMGFQKRKEADMKKDFFMMKGALEEIFTALGVTGVRFEEAGGELVASVFVHDTLLGEMSVAGLEIDMTKLVDLVNERVVFVSPSRYPSIIRDVSLFVSSQTRAGDVDAVIRQNAGTLTRTVSLIDVFEQPEQQRKSFAFRMTLQSDDRTLSDEEANAVYDRVVDALRVANGDWVLRV